MSYKKNKVIKKHCNKEKKLNRIKKTENLYNKIIRYNNIKLVKVLYKNILR